MSERRMPLAYLVEHWQPGSFARPWTWADETEDLAARERRYRGTIPPDTRPHDESPGGYQRELEDYLRALGRVEEGVFLGDDGRCWDGHHRIVAAMRLGFPDVPLDDDSWPEGEPWLSEMARAHA